MQRPWRVVPGTLGQDAPLRVLLQLAHQASPVLLPSLVVFQSVANVKLAGVRPQALVEQQVLHVAQVLKKIVRRQLESLHVDVLGFRFGRAIPSGGAPTATPPTTSTRRSSGCAKAFCKASSKL